MEIRQILEDKQSNDQSFLDCLKRILGLVQEDPAKEVDAGQILAILSYKGYEALLILLSLPFCIPVQIPGFSTPFGILLGFIGFRIACGKGPWWPKWILEKKVKGKNVQKVVEKTVAVVRYFQKYLHPRFVVLTEHHFFLQLNGLHFC